jgi:hypothetical protein
MADAVRHITHFLRLDQQIEAARKHKNWPAFHRECGAQGLYFDNIEKQGRGYGCISFRLEKHGDTYQSFRVSTGSGRGVIDAVLSCFDAAVKQGFAVDPTLGGMLTDTAPPVAPDDLDALLGLTEPVAESEDELMDLIG